MAEHNAPHDRPLRILAAEPYYGGSHKNFLDGLIAHSRHRFDLFQFPPRKWKWRMRASAINFARYARERAGSFDIVFASDFLSMADFAGLCPQAASVPKVAYFHENQFTYPEQLEQNRDYQFLFTNITTCLAAGRVWFNSDYHRRTFIRETDLFLRRMPDFVPEGVAAEIEAKASVLHVGCDLDECDAAPRPPRSGPAVILWNHRWEHDKDPDTFFGVLFDLADRGADFRVVVLGERFRNYPPVFDAARERLAGRILQFGYLPGRAPYLAALAGCDVIVSTARQEFFGVAVVEAIACGCWPLLPDRLSYPEIIPPDLQRRHLYSGARDLRDRLERLIADPAQARGSTLRPQVERFSWKALAPCYDAAFAETAACV